MVLSIYGFLGSYAGETSSGYSGAIMVVTTQDGYSHVKIHLHIANAFVSSQ
jgi:hypothetical protein